MGATIDQTMERLDGLRAVLGYRESDDEKRQFALGCLAENWDKPNVPEHAWDAAATLMMSESTMQAHRLEPDFLEAVCRLIDRVDIVQCGDSYLELRHLRWIDEAYADVGAAIERWKAEA